MARHRLHSHQKLISMNCSNQSTGSGDFWSKSSAQWMNTDHSFMQFKKKTAKKRNNHHWFSWHSSKDQRWKKKTSILPTGIKWRKMTRRETRTVQEASLTWFGLGLRHLTKYGWHLKNRQRRVPHTERALATDICTISVLMKCWGGGGRWVRESERERERKRERERERERERRGEKRGREEREKRKGEREKRDLEWQVHRRMSTETTAEVEKKEQRKINWRIGVGLWTQKKRKRKGKRIWGCMESLSTLKHDDNRLHTTQRSPRHGSYQFWKWFVELCRNGWRPFLAPSSTTRTTHVADFGFLDELPVEVKQCHHKLRKWRRRRDGKLKIRK